MATRIISIIVLGVFIGLSVGCVKETTVHAPDPSIEKQPVEETDVLEETTEPNARVLASLKLTDQGRRFLEAGKADHAIRVLEQAISLNPSNGQNYYYLSEAWLTKGFVNEAREFNLLAESHLKNDQDWIKSVDQQADRILKLENKIKQSR